MPTDSPEYTKRKQFFNQLLTIYGRKPCLEAITDKNVDIFRLHLADSNKSAKILDDITSQASKRGAEILYHDKKALSRISKNSKQDQGVALDLVLKGFKEHTDYLAEGIPENAQFIALDKVTNPQNVGMIIRSVCASPLAGLILPRNGCAKLDSLVIKASAGTLFRANILRCDSLTDCLLDFKNAGANIVGLDCNAKTSLSDYPNRGRQVFILGNETEGLSNACEKICNQTIKIPMRNKVESLNVAITAGIIAFRTFY
ncbi:TrmH family RNA methyltransferase [Teredinibacter purpureus]|jgi:rRNA methylases|uniref:TrmH family RNA methyltransferase n=1 Tax=Teredinibacter purpureus TaxID=2731756 RepID=UPI0005F858E2|nr:RNA methyltransferase [Teredinibacter purpureus]